MSMSAAVAAAATGTRRRSAHRQPPPPRQQTQPRRLTGLHNPGAARPPCDASQSSSSLASDTIELELRNISQEMLGCERTVRSTHEQEGDRGTTTTTTQPPPARRGDGDGDGSQLGTTRKTRRSFRTDAEATTTTTTTRTNTLPAADDLTGTITTPSGRSHRGGFLSTLKPNWLGGGGGSNAPSSTTTTSSSTKAATHASPAPPSSLPLSAHDDDDDDRRNRRGSRSRSTSLDPASAVPSSSNSSSSRYRRRPSKARAEQAEKQTDDESCQAGSDPGGDVPETPRSRHRSRLSMVGVRFGRSRSRSVSPLPPQKTALESPEAAPLPLAASAKRDRKDRSKSRARADRNDKERRRPPVELDNSQNDGIDDQAHQEETDEASFADSIYSRAAQSDPVLEGLNPSEGDGPNHQTAEEARDMVPSTVLSVVVRVEPVRSLKDLRKRIEYAKSERWVRTQHAPLAAIRETLGLGHLAVDSPMKSNDAPAKRTLAEHVVPLFRKLVHSIQTKGDDSPYIQYVLNSSASEPEPAILVFQFLHYLDVLVASHQSAANPAEGGLCSEVTMLADEVAKMPTLACWCREILRYPDDFPSALLECCLGHLQRYVRIIDPAERMQHIWCILFRGSKERIALDELRVDLERVVNRMGRGDAQANDDARPGFLTLARAVFLYNSVERAVGANRTRGKPPGSSSPEDKLKAFRSALDRHRNQVPDVLVERLEKEMLPQCAGPCCFRRAGVRCCDVPNASYCSAVCRDRGWRRHRKVCQHGTKVELPFLEADSVPSEEAPLINEQEVDNLSSSQVLLESPQRRIRPDTKQALAALRTPKTPRVNLDVIDIFDELRVVPLVSQKSSTEWLLRQDMWLRDCPDFDYFLAQKWGKVGVQFASDKARAEFKELRRNAPHNVDDVEEMLEVLAKCCPELKHSMQQQLEREYSMDLSKAAESPTRLRRSSTTCAPSRGKKSTKPLITPSPPPKRRVDPTSFDGIDRSSPWSIVMS